ncbi:hypothetical protein [Ruficoccus sp. ZRK36]|uniref:hypothetical protein n=1 Tax=Ruficoccus sp. ZRK36 TaxID=2866311 RepID=UPI001C72A227|nr:hypothetical protein [Ruficoccus sp. ZRK36]QYY37189.1 hypothetical protein K0V07_06820 [Ruficoccus sp. ZRK36]
MDSKVLRPSFRIPLRPLVILGLIAACSVDSVSAAGLVMPIKRRDVTLSAGELYLRPPSEQVEAELAELKYPFAFERPPEPVGVAESEKTDSAAEETEAAPVVTRTDEEVLQAFSSKFEPTGMMARGQDNYLTVPVGDRTHSVKEGSLIRFNYENESYNVRISKVTDENFTLSLGEATLTRPLNTDFDKDQIKRFTPQP